MARTRVSHAADGRLTARSYDRAARSRLEDLQRSRILAAMFDVAAERGAAEATIAHVVKRSGVSRRTFYELFDDREECFLAAFEQALAFAAKRVLPAYEAHRRWRERIRAALHALLSFLDEEPLIGKLLIADSLPGSQRLMARRAGVLAEITRAIDAGGREAKKDRPDPLAAEAIVGGVLSVINTRLLRPNDEPLVGLTDSLMSMIVLPYLGAAAARRELDRPVSVSVKQPRDAGHLVSDPFKEAGMRLTYRTMCVLAALAKNPGGSNRTIGSSAGIEDQGQISKLLGRLGRNGLVVNTGTGPGTGAPNVWTLTDKGRQVIERIAAYAGEDGQ